MAQSYPPHDLETNFAMARPVIDDHVPVTRLSAKAIIKNLAGYLLCRYGFRRVGFGSSSFSKESNFPHCNPALRAVSFDGLARNPNSSEIEFPHVGRFTFFASFEFMGK